MYEVPIYLKKISFISDRHEAKNKLERFLRHDV